MSRSIRLTARFSESSSSKEELDFIEKEIENSDSQAEIVRKAIAIYQKYKEGNLFNEDKVANIVRDEVEKLLTNEIKSTDKRKKNRIDEVVSKLDGGEINLKL